MFLYHRQSLVSFARSMKAFDIYKSMPRSVRECTSIVSWCRSGKICELHPKAWDSVLIDFSSLRSAPRAGGRGQKGSVRGQLTVTVGRTRLASRGWSTEGPIHSPAIMPHWAERSELLRSPGQGEHPSDADLPWWFWPGVPDFLKARHLTSRLDGRSSVNL
jgi:hypothetical protein